jgi:hypothetical protein
MGARGRGRVVMGWNAGVVVREASLTKDGDGLARRLWTPLSNRANDGALDWPARAPALQHPSEQTRTLAGPRVWLPPRAPRRD